jgi:hypothetical protein
MEKHLGTSRFYENIRISFFIQDFEKMCVGYEKLLFRELVTEASNSPYKHNRYLLKSTLGNTFRLG